MLVNGYLSSQLTWNSQNLMQAKINKRTFNEAFPPISALRRHFRNQFVSININISRFFLCKTSKNLVIVMYIFYNFFNYAERMSRKGSKGMHVSYMLCNYIQFLLNHEVDCYLLLTMIQSCFDYTGSITGCLKWYKDQTTLTSPLSSIFVDEHITLRVILNKSSGMTIESFKAKKSKLVPVPLKETSATSNGAKFYSLHRGSLMEDTYWNIT